MASHLAVIPAQAGVHKIELRIKRLESVIASPVGARQTRKIQDWIASSGLAPLLAIVSQRYDIRENKKEEIQGLLFRQEDLGAGAEERLAIGSNNRRHHVLRPDSFDTFE